VSCNSEPSSPSSGASPSTPCDGTTQPCAPCDVTVTIGRVRRGNPYVARATAAAAAAAGLPDSVPPTKTYEVDVTLTWSGHCSGQQVAISIVNGSGDNGTATVSPAQLSASGTVTVTGGNQTGRGHGGQLKIRATFNGATKAESAGFTVCAHPKNWYDDMTRDEDGPRVGMVVHDNWDSDSGTFGDLDQTEISEVVSLPASPSPPFPPIAAAAVRTSGYLRGDRRSRDRLLSPRPAAGPAATWPTQQLSIFKCHRCGCTDKVVPDSGILHTDEVFRRGAHWFHKTVRVGAAQTIGAYTSGAASSINLTTADHALP